MLKPFQVFKVLLRFKIIFQPVSKQNLQPECSIQQNEVNNSVRNITANLNVYEQKLDKKNNDLNIFDLTELKVKHRFVKIKI